MAVLMALIAMAAPLAVLYLVAGPPVGREADPLDITLTAGDPAACQAEDALLRRLLAGEVDRGTYRAELARLAARDTDARPLHQPGDRPGGWTRGGGRDEEV